MDERFAEAVRMQVEELRQHLRQMRDPESLAEIPTGNGPIGLRR